jgi:integrase
MRCPELVKLSYDTSGALKRDDQGRAKWTWSSKHGMWGFQIDVAPAPGSGKERERIRRTGFPTMTAAKAARVAVEGKGSTAATRQVSNDRTTVGEWLDQWIAGRRKIRRATRVSYQGHIDHYLKPYLGEIKLRDLRSGPISAMFAALDERNAEIEKAREIAPRRRPKTEGVRARVLGPASMQRIRATLRVALNAAIKEELYDRTNPASLVELESGEAPRPQLWTAESEARWRETGVVPVPTMVWRPEQCGAFLDAAEGDRLYNLYEMASRTGMRRGELCGLRWSDVDLEASRMDVRVQLTVVAGIVEEGPTKSRAGERSVPLDDGLVAMLRAHRNQQRKDRLKWGEMWVDSGRVFVEEDGAELNPLQVSDRFRAIAHGADLPPVRLHAMRSGAATMALAAGVPMKVVSEMIGHSTEAITSKVYTAVSDELKRDAIKSIDALIPRRATGTEQAR